MSKVKGPRLKQVRLETTMGNVDNCEPGSREEREVLTHGDTSEWPDETFNRMALGLGISASQKISASAVLKVATVQGAHLVVEVAHAFAQCGEKGADLLKRVSDWHALAYRKAEAVAVGMKAPIKNVRSGVSNYRSFWTLFLFVSAYRPERARHIVDPTRRKMSEATGAEGKCETYHARKSGSVNSLQSEADSIISDESLGHENDEYAQALENRKDAQKRLNEANEKISKIQEEVFMTYQIASVKDTESPQYNDALKAEIASL